MSEKINLINTVYDVEGFNGVLNLTQSVLRYGEVREVSKGLYCITSGGWSEDETLLHNLINYQSKFRKHYVGYIVGGAFYFVEDKENFSNVKMILD